MEKIWKFIKDEDGLELSEYAVVGALILLGAVAAITRLGEMSVLYCRLYQMLLIRLLRRLRHNDRS